MLLSYLVSLSTQQEYTKAGADSASGAFPILRFKVPYFDIRLEGQVIAETAMGTAHKSANSVSKCSTPF